MDWNEFVGKVLNTGVDVAAGALSPQKSTAVQAAPAPAAAPAPSNHTAYWVLGGFAALCFVLAVIFRRS